MKGFAVVTFFSGFQSVAGLAFCLSLCTVVTMHFKYLHGQLKECVAFRINTDSVQELSSVAAQIRTIRNLYEHTCDLTTTLDDGVNLFAGTQFLILIPAICLFTLNAFVPAISIRSFCLRRICLFLLSADIGGGSKAKLTGKNFIDYLYIFFDH